MLPFDLHVLSLPLAFILSQDQTLHCIISCETILLSMSLLFFGSELFSNVYLLASIKDTRLLRYYLNLIEFKKFSAE